MAFMGLLYTHPFTDQGDAALLGNREPSGNKWSKNFDERPHRRPVTPPSCEFVRPWLPSLGLPESATQTA